MSGIDVESLYDVTGTVNLCSPIAVWEEIHSSLIRCYPDYNSSLLEAIFSDLISIYKGNYPGYHACDTGYHDLTHVLSVSLAMARLIEGYEHAGACDKTSFVIRAEDQLPLGERYATIGMVVALFHDVGYIRSVSDGAGRNGAEYTLSHVSRGAVFLRHYLAALGLNEDAEIASELIHYTGYECSPESLFPSQPQLQQLGFLLGTADVMAQMAEENYPAKCRDQLFKEFEVAGISILKNSDGTETVVYQSGDDLLSKTPDFIQSTIEKRLKQLFRQSYAFVENCFNGQNLYMQSIERNHTKIATLIETCEDGSIKVNLA